MYESDDSIVDLNDFESRNLPINYVDLVKNQNLFKALTFSYLASIFLFFFYFGGFNIVAFHLMLTLSASFLTYLVFFEFDHFKSVIAKKNTKLVIFLLLFFCFYILIQYLLILNKKVEHPIFGEVSKHYFQYGWFYFLKEPLFILTNFLIFSTILTSDYYQKIVTLFIRVLGILIAITALMHWFYDNGKLFWFIEPYIVFISNRARWPFVNSNHCGAILASIFVFQISTFVKKYKHFTSKLNRNRLTKKFNEILIPSNFNKLLNVFYELIFSFIIVLAVLATASRASWAVALLVIFLFTLFISAKPKKEKEKRKVFSIKKILKNPFNNKFVKLFLIYFIGILSLLIFISGRGEDIVVNRANYALTSSMSDLRFSFYEITKPMLYNNFFFGIGFKNWNEAFKAVKLPEMSQGDPVFLHSDPYQLLVELGFIGLLPLFALAVYFIFLFFKSYKKARSRKLVTYFVAIIALFSSSLVDFPFRSPAIMIYLMIICTLFINELEIKTK